jgi:periplasmic protein TonB
MNEAVRSASPYFDEPWRRFAWIVPLAVLVWALVLTAFALILEQTAAPPVELKPVEARIIELPPTAGLQGGARAPHPAAPAVPKPKPHVVARPKPVPIHHVKPLAEVPLSPFGTSKTTAAPAAPAAGTEKPSAAETGQGVSGGSGTGSGSGLGNDSGGARALYAPTPTIPDDLRDETFNAVAMAHFKVSYSGDVQVSLTQPTSSPRLNEILLETLKQWRFFPAMKNGVAVDSEFDVRIPITVQ